MGYYDIYLKRMNAGGNTWQERIKTRKEKEFNNLYLKRTEYQSKIYSCNQKDIDIVCSLQPNKWNETQLLSNLLVSTLEEPFKTGDILNIYQKIKDIEYDKIWLVIFCDNDITKGYLKYKLLCLDEMIDITNEYGDTLYSIPVKFVNSSATFLKDLFSFTKESNGYREPNAKRRIITHSFDFIKKDLYFNYKDKGWKIEGIDDISINRVGYFSISERLINEVEPRTSEEILVGEDTNFFLNNR